MPSASPQRYFLMSCRQTDCFFDVVQCGINGESGRGNAIAKIFWVWTTSYVEQSLNLIGQLKGFYRRYLDIQKNFWIRSSEKSNMSCWGHFLGGVLLIGEGKTIDQSILVNELRDPFSLFDTTDVQDLLCKEKYSSSSIRLVRNNSLQQHIMHLRK